MSKKKFIISGVSGKIGGAFAKYLADHQYQYIGIYHHNQPKVNQKNGVSFIKVNLIKNLRELEKVDHQEFKYFFHLAAKTHIDECEKDKSLKEKSSAWIGNVETTKNVIRFCLEQNKKLIYFSTECVFDGDKDFYTEDDETHPINWYGVTKRAAEKLIIDSGVEYLIIRSVIVYGSESEPKDIAQFIRDGLKTNQILEVVADQRMTPTHIQDLIKGTIALVNKNACGIYHLAGQSVTTPYEIAEHIAQLSKLSLKQVKAVSLREFFGSKGAKLRVKNACFNSDKFMKLTGVRPLDIKKGLCRVKKSYEQGTL